MVLAVALLLLLIASVTWAVFAVRVLGTAWGRELSDIPPRLPPRLPAGDWPLVSVVIACRNEQAAVAAAVRSLLAQDYPTLEVIAVDDRSTDSTGAILDLLARDEARVRVLHIAALPTGWLGKNNALQQGAAVARGDWLLFTDADVHFAPDALRRAIAWVITDGLGHAVALPRFDAPHFLERSFVSLFALFLLGRLDPSQLRRAGSRAYVGAGAFNLMSADAYRGVGGHTRLPLEVADDLKLGLVLRRSGVRQGCLLAGSLVHVRWQNGFIASMRGLYKNFFAGLEFRWWPAVGIALGVPLLTVGPLSIAAWPAALPPAVRAWAVLVWAGSSLVMGAMARRAAGGSGLEGIALPVAGLGVAYVSLASALLTTLRGGVVWRDTLYPLDELRAGCVRERDWPPDRAPGL